MNQDWDTEEGKAILENPENPSENSLPDLSDSEPKPDNENLLGTEGTEPEKLDSELKPGNENTEMQPPPPSIIPAENVYWRVDSLFRWIFLGILCLFLIGHWESKYFEKKPWSRGIVVWNDKLIKEIIDAIPEETDFKKLLVIPDVQPSTNKEDTFVQLLKQIEVGDKKDIPALSYPAFLWMESMDDFLPMLISGRLPESGKPEALAGDLTPTEPFKIGDTVYSIVGILSRDYAPFLGAYVVPFENLPNIPEDVMPGFAFPDSTSLFSKLQANGKKYEKIDLTEGISGLQGRTTDLFSFGTAISLLIICLSLKELLFLFYRRMAAPPTPLLGPLFTEISQRKNLFRFVNTFFYAVFFVNLFIALYEPETHRLMIYYITHVFSEGDLKYIGEAYEQGNIMLAAITTFHNNFWVQTFLLTILISIPPFMLGLFKNLISFSFAGYAMSPIWSGSAIQLTFHSITIVLELEAYILAVFAVVLWTYYFWNAVFTRKQLKNKISKGFRALIASTLASGCILAIAGLYEAITIILFSSL